MTASNRAPGSPEAVKAPSSLGFELDDGAWLQQVRRAVAPAGPGIFSHFEILEEFARGAQGVVYRARDLNTRRIVALKKLVSGSFATSAQRERFEREAKAVASLRHPGIVTVYGYDFLDGQPVLAMEWVEGLPIDAWARASPTPTLDHCLKVFLATCDAVQHAHQRGIIHRDLKSPNILVDVADQPHVLDFGLAKFLNEAESSQAALTRTQDLVGTPAYAAPEQVRGEQDAVDVRTDVYALGVVLYQLLTGRLPHPQQNLAELLHAIQHVDPPAPSRICPRADRELDAVVAMAMARDPERRYPSVDALAADVGRYLAGDPVEACRRGPNARGYVFRKTLRRYRAGIAVTVGVLLFLGGALGVSVWLYGRQAALLREISGAREEERRARMTSEDVQKVLQEVLLLASEVGRGTDRSVREQLLKGAAERVRASLAGKPAALATAQAALGRAYQTLGLYADADFFLRAALELRKATFEPGDPAIAESLIALGELWLDMNRPGEAEQLFQEALAIRRPRFGDASVETAACLDRLGLVQQYHRDYEGARRLHEEAYVILRSALGDRDVSLFDPLQNLGVAHANQGGYAEAEGYYRRALDLLPGAGGEAGTRMAGIKIELAKALMNQGSFAEAESLLREATETFRDALGEQHDNVAWGLHRLGVLLHMTGRGEEAETAMREAMAIYRRIFGDDDMYVSLVRANLGTVLMDLGRCAEAEQLFEEEMRISRRIRGDADPFTVWKGNRLGELRARQALSLNAAGRENEAAERATEAESLLRAAIGHSEQLPGVERIQLTRSMIALAELLLQRGEWDEADKRLRTAIEWLETQPGHSCIMARLHLDLGRLEMRRGRLREAVEFIARARDLGQRRATPTGFNPRQTEPGCPDAASCP